MVYIDCKVKRIQVKENGTKFPIILFKIIVNQIVKTQKECCIYNVGSLLVLGNQKRFSRGCVPRTFSGSVCGKTPDSRPSNHETAGQTLEQDGERSSVEVSIIENVVSVYFLSEFVLQVCWLTLVKLNVLERIKLFGTGIGVGLLRNCSELLYRTLQLNPRTNFRMLTVKI